MKKIVILVSAILMLLFGMGVTETFAEERTHESTVTEDFDVAISPVSIPADPITVTNSVDCQSVGVEEGSAASYIHTTNFPVQYYLVVPTVSGGEQDEAT